MFGWINLMTNEPNTFWLKFRKSQNFWLLQNKFDSKNKKFSFQPRCVWFVNCQANSTKLSPPCEWRTFWTFLFKVIFLTVLIFSPRTVYIDKRMLHSTKRILQSPMKRASNIRLVWLALGRHHIERNNVYSINMIHLSSYAPFRRVHANISLIYVYTAGDNRFRCH